MSNGRPRVPGVPCTMSSVKFLVFLSICVAVTSGCYLFPSDVPNPCHGVVCGPGALCQPSADGRSYECECPTSCPSYGDHEGSRPLCGSDARDYPGDCEMRKAACESNTNITFKYYGKCDPCAGVTCPDPEVCQLDERRSPSCRCAESCPLEFSPVCASDGKTYSNECQMNRESCRARKQLRVVFKGQCSSGVNPCAEVECRHGAECRVETNSAVCACPPPCEPVLRPVCGADGRTHDSECELRRAACLLGRDIPLVHAGACGSSGVCAGHVCPHGGECVSSGGRGVCRCPRCSNEFAPVCGSDGISYGNRCKLQLEACRHRRDVQVLYDGPCNGCENKKCENYAVCESDGVSEASCVCPKHCEEGTETEEVCGSDNETYSSVCALRDTACREKRHLHVHHMGTCESCAGVKCSAGTWCSRGTCSCARWCADAAREPVCSDTGRSFANVCAMERAACEAGARGEAAPTVAHYGECEAKDNKTVSNNSDISNDINSIDETSDTNTPVSSSAVCARVQCAFEATCAIDAHAQPRCACLFDCAAAAAAPVCASDMRLYPTLCHMKLEACRKQEDLRLRPLPLCHGLEFRPCGDDEPLTDAGGHPLDCGGGPHRKDCPAGSFCHHTAKAARCCRKDKATEEKKSCQDSWHGCCADGVTAALGPGGAGCNTRCGCHRLGAVAERCSDTGQCDCRPGVGGLKCDRCEPGYWGLPRIGSGHSGCIPCGCSAFGSVREDCEQMTGRCVCKPGIQGQKCTVCSNHEHTLGPNGCYDQNIEITVQTLESSCATETYNATNIKKEEENEKANEILYDNDYSSYEDYLDEKDEDNEFYRVPLFDGMSSLVARVRLPAKRFDIWAEVSAVCGDGALLSASGTKDHLWLGFVDDRAVLRWDVGSGPMEIRAGKIRTDGRSKLSARRYRKDALLRLGPASAAGSSQGRMTALNVDPFLYIGQHPDNVTKLAGAGTIGGFVGCVHRLRVNGHDVIPPSRGMLLSAYGLKPCTPNNLARLVCP